MAQNNILEYKGYHTKVEFDADDFILIGKIEGITDFIDFECDDISNVEKEFHEAVDDYLEFCKEVGKEPDKEYKGTFNVRISPELHKQLSEVAWENGDTLNASVEKAIQNYVLNEQINNKYIHNTNVFILQGEMKSESTYQYSNYSQYKNDNSFIRQKVARNY